MITYEASDVISGAGGQTVLVQPEGVELDPRLDLWNHSPDGFQWGYGGSGPAQLALAILADYFDRMPTAELGAIADALGLTPDSIADGSSIGDALAVRMHQMFKALCIAPLEQGTPFVMSSHTIEQALDRIISAEKGD